MLENTGVRRPGSFPQGVWFTPTLTEKIHNYRIGATLGPNPLHGKKTMNSHSDMSNEERNFGEFRRKVRSAEVLSASMERLLLSLRFTGRLSVVMQNGRVLKSGYEEGYFRQREAGGPDDEITQKL